MVDRGGLENRCSLTGTQGSNPCLSATPTDNQTLAKVWGKKWGKNPRKMPFEVSSFVYTTIGPFHNEPMTE